MYQLRSLGYKNLPFAILSKFFQLWVEFPMKVVKSCMGEKKPRQSWFISLKSTNEQLRFFTPKTSIEVLDSSKKIECTLLKD